MLWSYFSGVVCGPVNKVLSNSFKFEVALFTFTLTIMGLSHVLNQVAPQLVGVLEIPVVTDFAEVPSAVTLGQRFAHGRNLVVGLPPQCHDIPDMLD